MGFRLPRRAVLPVIGILACLAVPPDARAEEGADPASELELKRSMDSDARRSVDQGARALRAGALEDALSAYQTALALDPNRVEARLGMGLALEGLGRQREAARAYDRAARARPGDGDIRARLVAALGQLTPEEALEPLGRLAARHPADPNITEAIGLLLLRQNRPLAAMGALEHAAALDPGSSARWRNFAVAADRAGQVDKAIPAYRRALTLARIAGGGNGGGESDLAALSRRARWLEARREGGGP